SILLTPSGSVTVTRFPSSLSIVDNVEIEELLHWLQTTVNVLQSAATSSDFFQKAADAVVEIVGLHSGRVLLRDNGGWKTVAENCGVSPLSPTTIPPGDKATSSTPPPSADKGKSDGQRPLSLPSAHVLQRVVQDKCTFWESQDLSALKLTDSLRGIEAVV